MNNEKLEGLFLTVQKPGRYAGGEVGSTVKEKNKVALRFAFCFPDTYEIGMSHLGIKILYEQFNERPEIWCERVFAPWVDFEQVMQEHNIPLFALESRDPLTAFNFIGFTLQYELSYTNVLNMLRMGNIPLYSAERGDDCPIVVAGGPCACNPEPMADFIDLFFLGEGEEVDLEVLDLYLKMKKDGSYSRRQFLINAAKIKGVYVPGLYRVSYREDGTVAAVEPLCGAPLPIEKRIMPKLDQSYYPKKFPIPYIDIVHDRAVMEIFRGCIRGAAFARPATFTAR